MPKIGYGSNKKTKHMMPNGLKAVTVSNTRDVSIHDAQVLCILERLLIHSFLLQLDLLLMHTNKYAATIAHNVSSKKRIEILARAKILNVKVTNAAARLRTEEA